MRNGAALRLGTRAFLAIAVASTLAVASPAAQVAQASTSNQMLRMTNEDRRDANRKPLRLDRRLSRYAVKHSKQMARRGEIFHTPNLAKVLNRNWRVAGENVGNGGDLAALEDAFMDSTDHRKNILRRSYDHAAVGVVSADGSLWVTVIFYG